MEIIIISIVSTLILTTLVWIIFFKNIQTKLTHDKEKLSIELFNLKSNIDFEVNKKLEEKVILLNEQILELKNKCITIERESYEKGKKDAAAEFEKDYFVNVIPYKETYEADREYIIFGKKNKYVNVGFQRQLFVKGIPVFDPVYSFVEKYEFNEFKLNEEAINRLVNNAIKAIAPQAGSFIKVADDIMDKK
ncbi:MULTISPECIES: hypothetical protein [unclassified Flavobacterium]|uniref:hypothetical protein n=1 Tax=unclassified Flavobacterium TaxID=196869 RepID=UPI00257F7055|nr:hypothetical protein [Flavobacterium sp. UBA4854]